MTTIYRFKFSEDFLPILVEFSTIHQYDEPKDFKEAFEEWKEENRSLITKETIRLENIGYEGNMFDKMYKSARYYFKNKDRSDKSNKKRRVYIRQDKDFINTVDRHLNVIVDLKPSEAFNDFKTKYVDIFENECLRIGEFLDKEQTLNKIKKTYKNRYFLANQTSI
tara:strand:- start:164 stop:661 length:498 start_codon:yes stop_codon:yes gene_type:complete